MKVYLAGGIFGLTDGDAKDWREEAKQTLKHDTLDPMVRDYRGREAESVNEIVYGDLHDIDNSGAVLANCAKPSWGTAMEIHYATEKKDIPVYAVVPDGPISPWLAFYTQRIFCCLKDAVEALNTLEG